METCMHGWVQTFFFKFFCWRCSKGMLFFPPSFPAYYRRLGNHSSALEYFGAVVWLVFFFRLLLRSPTTVITASNHRAHPKPRRAPFSLVSGVSAKVVRRAKLPQLIWNSCVLVLFRLVLYVARVIRNLPVLYKLNAADRESRKRENLENGDRYKNL